MLGISNLRETGDVRLIAEIAQSHDGSLGLLHSFIDALAPTGVDGLKFQVHIAAAESSEHEAFRTKFSYEDDSRFEYWRRMEFTTSQWAEVKQHCEGVGLKFLASAFSVEAVRLLNDIGCETYKIGSGDLTNLLMIDQILKVAQEIIISTGLSTDQEVAKVVDRLQRASVPFALLHCTSEYPTPPRHMNLQMITRWMSQVSCPVGLSDHSATIYAGLAAVALGASLIEVHATFDRRMFGPDSTSSLSINEIAMLADGIKWLVASRSEVSPHKRETWHVMRDLFGRSLAAAQDLKVGQSLEADHLEAKKPSGFGIPASEYESVIGKKLTRDIPKGHFITIDAVSSS